MTAIDRDREIAAVVAELGALMASLRISVAGLTAALDTDDDQEAGGRTG